MTENVRFGSGPDFAEVAEAIGVSTGDVLAARPSEEGETYTVLYSPDGQAEDPEVLGCRLTRDADGILVKGPDVSRGHWSDIKAQINSAMAKRFPPLHAFADPRHRDDAHHDNEGHEL